MKLIFA